MFVGIINGHILGHGAENRKLFPLEGDAVAALELFQVISDTRYGPGPGIDNGILAVGAVTVESRAREGVLIRKGRPRRGVGLHGDRIVSHIGIITGKPGGYEAANRHQHHPDKEKSAHSRHVFPLWLGAATHQIGLLRLERNRWNSET